LERFFKANLENYAPMPAADFWQRMEGGIPPKPSAWGGWASLLWKWAGLGALAVAILVVALLWQRDHQRLAKLNKTVAAQQRQLDELGNAASKQQATQATVPTFIEPSASNSNNTGVNLQSQPTAASSAIGNKGGQATKPLPWRTPTSGWNGDPLFKESVFLKELKEVQHSESQPFAGATESDLSIASTLEKTTEATQAATSPSSIAFGNMPVLTKKKQIPPFYYKPKRGNEPYPRFAVEVSAASFVMPMNRLFASDTFYTGQLRPSLAGGFLVDVELSRKLMVQGGYQFFDLRSERLALRYNSFPVAIGSRIAWGRRGHLEGKLGASVNTLVNVRTATDGIAVKGLKRTWVGMHGSLNATWPFADRLRLIVGPHAGFSLSPITKGRRSWYAGLNAGVRYHLW
jgi:hypothetical protein